ncbi:hypothetical protein A3D88_02860 [Candidatus Peribacteria bacterium RIFCSPHIGHO2_02_FULL_52_16]|nr:MAG: hypothetical protein A2706_00690 [Candidatus Peribacteria bacterium RIFCSPHIGHO2_01_FULL_51_35]OGJ61698.1 MAG: hypothetical protein A3D88_02860 [Candidatus Peribacteria bacterium RIFCSPHIGHO2_02_FULL_52_16]
MQPSNTVHALQKRFLPVLTAVVFLLLVAKFFWPLMVFDVPLGYDPGLYRYLFLRYAEAFPALPELDVWAQEQPMGLFLLFAPLVKLFSVEPFLGFLWNAVPVLLVASLAWIIAKRNGRTMGALVLLMGLLSVAQYHGFLLMYWKTLVSLLFMIFSFYYVEKKSWIALPFGILTIAIHQQTGFLFIATITLWFLFQLFAERKKMHAILALLLLCMIAGGLLTYLPVWNRVVSGHLNTLLTSYSSLPAGAFEPISFFLFHSGILFAFGIFGLLLNVRHERGTLWQCAAFLSLLFILIRFFFYRRFILQFDFFLLPFAAYGLRELWFIKKAYAFRALLIVLVLVQAIATAHAVHPDSFPLWCTYNRTRCEAFPPISVQPDVSSDMLAGIQEAGAFVPVDALLLALEPQIAPWLRGWLPYHTIAGPGIFSSPWDYAGWEKFLLGTHADRVSLLKGKKAPMYLFVTPFFTTYYESYAEKFLNDSCFKETASPYLLSVTCL